ncbi:hypothetical protein H1C71_041983 [Ictidomys tridecemlineatus]|nr:hypothetical protein H1C71_041983 [Ictidomys tridecemlineatus]
MSAAFQTDRLLKNSQWKQERPDWGGSLCSRMSKTTCPRDSNICPCGNSGPSAAHGRLWAFHAVAPTIPPNSVASNDHLLFECVFRAGFGGDSSSVSTRHQLGR